MWGQPPSAVGGCEAPLDLKRGPHTRAKAASFCGILARQAEDITRREVTYGILQFMRRKSDYRSKILQQVRRNRRARSTSRRGCDSSARAYWRQQRA